MIIDSNSVLHRAYHALPALSSKSGELVNAVYGFLLVFFKVVQEFDPKYIVAAFDFPSPTIRHEKYKEYKATRKKAPDEFYQQIPKIKEILEAFNVPILEKKGYEADDIIGTISRITLESPQKEAIVVSGDCDILQLINERIKVYVLRKGVKDTLLYDQELTREKYGGLSPQQLVDFKSLKGDVSDNIPGVQGIGEKTALSLILAFGSLENLYDEIDKGTENAKKIAPKVKEKLIQNKKQAFLSKELVMIEKEVPLDFSFEEKKWKDYKKEKVIESLEKLGFYSLVKRLPGSVEKKAAGQNLKLW